VFHSWNFTNEMNNLATAAGILAGTSAHRKAMSANIRGHQPGNLDEKKTAGRGRWVKESPLRRLKLLRRGRLPLNLQEKLYRIREVSVAICVRPQTGAESFSSPSHFGPAIERVSTEQIKSRRWAHSLYRNADWTYRRDWTYRGWIRKNQSDRGMQAAAASNHRMTK
jgi:hypothetical protein